MMSSDSLIKHIKKHLDQVGLEEQKALFMGFLEERETISREFVQFCAFRAKEDVSLHRGWVLLGEALEKIMREEKEEVKEEARRSFLEEIEKFRKDCMEGECVRCADSDDKRRAYADGDYYLEAFEEAFIDDHEEIQGFIWYTTEADKYYEIGDYEAASKAYRILLDIYHHDTEVEHCFVEDDDFPDLDLSQIGEIDIDSIRKLYEECIVSLKTQRNISDKGGNELGEEE